MGQTVEGKTIEQSLLDAYKAQLSTYDALLSVKDAQVAFLEAQIKGLKLGLDQYKSKHQDSTGLTAKEREEIAKLSKEIMDQPAEELEWPDGLSIVLEVGGPNMREELSRILGTPTRKE